MRHKFALTRPLYMASLLAMLVMAMPLVAQETPMPTPLSNKDHIADDPAVAQVVDRLKASTEQPVNLSDVSAAQDLMARIDLLSTLQEKINKLDTLKNEKKNKANDLAALDNLPMQGAMGSLPLPAAGGTIGSTIPDLELVSVQGSGNNLNAIVQSGGSTFKVSPRNRMVKDYQVLEIKPNYILVKRKGEKEPKQIYLASSE